MENALLDSTLLRSVAHVWLCLCNWFTSIVITAILVYIGSVLTRWLRVDTGTFDTATARLLEATSHEQLVPEECLSMVRALELAPLVHDEAECAAQMRNILRSGHLKFASLVDAPEMLLRCSPGMLNSNGSLWTRFTVQYNLYAGSIVALGSDDQRAELFKTQSDGTLGCFAFTERGAGVLSGAAVETTATYDAPSQTFVVNTPSPSAAKNWISQGLFAERAVILANLFIDGDSKGPHLFWAKIATRDAQTGSVSSVPGVSVGTNPTKTTMLGLDNATIRFDNFRIPREALLSRFSGIDPESNSYILRLPEKCSRMLDLLLSRLLTGRIVLSEATLAHAMSRLRKSWAYAEKRELWRGRRSKGRMMSEMTLVRIAFREYARTTNILQHFIAQTRERVATAIREQAGFTDDLVEATCMCKFLGTGFGVDCVSAVRKTLGARSLQLDAGLGCESFLPNATSAAEGDNTIMELKVVQDIVRGRTSKLPLQLMLDVSGTPQGRAAAATYLLKFTRALLLGKKAIKDGQLLRDIAWSRAHLRVIAAWLHGEGRSLRPGVWLESYARVAMRFPVPLQM